MNDNKITKRDLAILSTSLIVGFLFFSVVDIDITKSQTASVGSVSILQKTEEKKEREVKENLLKDISVRAQTAFVVDLNSGDILYKKDELLQLPLASVTKLMMAIVVSEKLDANTLVTITPEALLREGEYSLHEGEKWRLSDLMDYTLVISSNDGAEALAEAFGGRTKMVRAMNIKAKVLGLTQTYFLDETGLDESETLSGGYGSAKDVARVLAYIYKINPSLIEATSKDTLTIESESGFIHTVHNTNKAFKDIPGLIGGKTGFTDLAGGNLGIIFDKGLNQPVIAVVLGSTKDERFVDMKKLVGASLGI